MATNERAKSGAMSQSSASVIGEDDRTQVCQLFYESQTAYHVSHIVSQNFLGRKIPLNIILRGIYISLPIQ